MVLLNVAFKKIRSSQWNRCYGDPDFSSFSQPPPRTAGKRQQGSFHLVEEKPWHSPWDKRRNVAPVKPEGILHNQLRIAGKWKMDHLQNWLEQKDNVV